MHYSKMLMIFVKLLLFANVIELPRTGTNPVPTIIYDFGCYHKFELFKWGKYKEKQKNEQSFGGCVYIEK